jgi:hypothetical protein
MSFLLPSALVVGALAAVAVIAAHFITRSRPRPEPLPTARFIPDRPLRARARTLSLDDIALLLLRMAALLALTLAVAAPVRSAAHGRVLRVFAIDRSRAVASAREVRDSVSLLARPGDVTVVFDTAASLATSRALDSLAVFPLRGALSTALAAAIGLAARLATQTDSIELVLVTPFATEELDDATMRIRRSWPGRLRLVAVRSAATSAFDSRVESSTPEQDPVVAVVALAGLRGRAGASIRLLRDVPSVSDSAWAREAGHVLIHWPTSAASASWPTRTRIDTVGAVTAAGSTVVGRFPRVWSIGAIGGRPIARWIDGEPAAVERTTGAGCAREVAISIDLASDLTLRPAFRPFLQSLLMPCGGAPELVPLSRATLDSLAGAGPLVPASVVRDPHERSSPWTTWLLGAGAVLLIIELSMRRQRSAAQ